jgi:PhnB protein
MAVHHIPSGFTAITPYLVVEGAARLLDFVQKAFDAEILLRMDGPDGLVHHAQVKLGGAMLELANTAGTWAPMPAGIHLYVPDCDATYRRALDAGAVSLLVPEDRFYGERSASVTDPFGNVWHIATHTEDVSPEEMKRRAGMGK